MPNENNAGSEDRKAALAEGRRQGKVVRNYLEALDSQRPKRGRPRTSKSIQARLDTIDASLADASPVQRLELIQERLDLTSELQERQAAESIDELEAAFVDVAAPYARRKGISYLAWREVGVPAPVLRRANISRSSHR